MLLRNARLIDGTGRLLDRTDIRIEGYRIGAIGRGLPPQKEEWDLDGATVIPGLINAHVHLALDAGPDPIGRAVQLPPAYLALEGGRRAEAMLRAGITTARDLGGIGHADLALRRAIAEGIVQGPRLLVSGRLICMTGGHGWQMGVEADGPDAVRKAARTEIKAGVDVVKIMATGGIMTAGVEPGAAQFTEEEIRAGVEEAHKAGLRAATHAQGTTGIHNAVRAGIDSVEHGFFLTEPLCEEMAQRQTFLVPTLAAPFFISEAGEDAGIAPFAVEKSRRVLDEHRASVALAHKTGVPIALGNDAGTPFNRHDDVVTELRLLVEVGLSPMEALLAATGQAARLLGIEEDVGTVQVGKQADLVVLEGDPLADISAVGQIGGVFKAGRRIA